MENKKPKFGIQNHSPNEVATALHSFSRDMQSYYKVTHGQLLSRLDEVNDEEELSCIKAELQNVNLRIEYFHVLNNAASIVDVVLHSPIMIEEVRDCTSKE
ncbi:MAG: hypothetical protein AAGF01_07705 [Cyanobacteria bacterium P01_G01_bin.38]